MNLEMDATLQYAKGNNQSGWWPKVKPEDICYAVRLATANATAGVEKVGATEGTLTKKDFASPRWKKLPISVRKI